MGARGKRSFWGEDVRGEVLEVGPDGAGQISGEDGVRYPFHTREVSRFIIQWGDRVDFIPVDGRATEIMFLASTPQIPRAADYTRSRRAQPDAGSPWGYFLRCMSKFADGECRAPPREYWWFVFFRVLMIGGLVLPGLIVGGSTSDEDTGGLIAFLSVAAAALVFLATFIPDLVAKVRRLHDIGVTGFVILLGLIPGGSLVVLIMLVMPSNRYANSYGPVPPPARPDRGDGRWD